MSMHRRAVVGALVFGVVAGCGARLAVAAPASMQFADVRVDTAQIAARGLPNYARRVAALAGPAARAALAPRLGGGRGAPILVLSLRLVQLTSDPSGSRDRFFGRDIPLDWIEGDAILLDARGREIKRTRFHTMSDASTIERISTPEGEDRRIARLAELFARWSISELGL